MNTHLDANLKQLRLPGMRDNLAMRVQEAQSAQLGHEQFLELLIQDELALRNDRKTARALKVARFINLKPLDRFDWQFNPNIDRRQILELATCAFIRQHTDLLMIGPPGTGKTHLAQGIGYEAIKRGHTVRYISIFDLVRELMDEEAIADGRLLSKYLKPDLLIIDDMGLKQLPTRAGEHLFEVIMRRYELRSTLMTSNRPIEDWGHLIGDVPAAGAILDRLLQSAEIIPFKGRSYRLRHSTSKPEKEAEPDIPR
jgi:DNA replication protein DnaC